MKKVTVKLTSAEAIRECLRHLGLEAREIGLNFSAHLIEVAAESIPRRSPKKD